MSKPKEFPNVLTVEVKEIDITRKDHMTCPIDRAINRQIGKHYSTNAGYENVYIRSKSGKRTIIYKTTREAKAFMELVDNNSDDPQPTTLTFRKIKDEA